MTTCRASLAFSRPSACTCRQKIRRVGLAIFRLTVAGRPDFFRRNAQRFGDQPFAFGPATGNGVCQRGGGQPGFAGNGGQRRSPLFQRRDNVGGMPVLLHHAVTPSINFTPSAVRIQRGAFSSAAKYQTSSHKSPVSVRSIFGSNARPVRSCASESE